MKIVFRKAVIKNFFSIGSAEIRLDTPGITLVLGTNEQDALSASNGSGKSSIFEAVLWCLTGFTSRGSSEVSNICTGRPASVELFLSADKSDYEIKRTAAPSTLAIRKDGQDISGSTFTKSKKILADLLNFVDYDMLSSIIILTQGLNGRLSNLKPSERKSRLELFSNLQRLIDSVTDTVSAVACDIDNNCNSSSKELAAIEGKISSSQKLIEGCVAKIREIEENAGKILSKKDAGQLEEEIAAIKMQAAQAEDKIASLRLLQNSAAAEKISIESRLSGYRKEIGSIKQNYVAALSKICPLCSQPLRDNTVIDRYDLRLNELSNLIASDLEALSRVNFPSQEQISALENTKKMLDSELAQKHRMLVDSARYDSSIETWQEMLRSAEDEIKSLEPQLLPLRTSVSALGKDSQLAKWYKQAIPRKFRNFLLDNVVGYMNRRLEHYSKYLFSDRAVRLENDGSNLLIKLGSLGFENLSGGEGRRVDLLLQLSLRDLAINQSGFYCNLLVMDEVFDYLDDAGIENFLLMIDKESSFSESLMVITHRKDAAIPVSQRLAAIKSKDGITTVEAGT